MGRPQQEDLSRPCAIFDDAGFGIHCPGKNRRLPKHQIAGPDHGVRSGHEQVAALWRRLGLGRTRSASHETEERQSANLQCGAAFEEHSQIVKQGHLDSQPLSIAFGRGPFERAHLCPGQRTVALAWIEKRPLRNPTSSKSRSANPERPAALITGKRAITGPLESQ